MYSCLIREKYYLYLCFMKDSFDYELLCLFYNLQYVIPLYKLTLKYYLLYGNFMYWSAGKLLQPLLGLSSDQLVLLEGCCVAVHQCIVKLNFESVSHLVYCFFKLILCITTSFNHY